MKRALLCLLLICACTSLLAQTRNVEGANRKAYLVRYDSVLTLRDEQHPMRIDIPDYAYFGCGELTEIRIVARPGAKVTIGEGAFRDCPNLRRVKVVTLGKGKVKVGREAFSGCAALHTLEMPRAVEFGSRAFAYCSSLRDFDFAPTLKSIGTATFAFCRSLTSAEIPTGVTTLESYAFAECTGLERVTLPAACRELGELLLTGCRSLREIRSDAVLPPQFECGSTLFDPAESDLYGTCRLTVPAEARDAYTAAPGWEFFKTP